MIKNKITRSEMVDPAILADNPLNYRGHPDHQQKAMLAALNEVGWVQNVVVNERTGHIIDGHMRAELARAAGEQVPVVFVDISEAEERAIIATMDPLAAIAATDNDKARELADMIHTDSAELAALIAVAGYDDPALGAPPDEDNYREQFGLIIEADSELERDAILKDMQRRGYTVKGIVV